MPGSKQAVSVKLRPEDAEIARLSDALQRAEEALSSSQAQLHLLQSQLKQREGADPRSTSIRSAQISQLSQRSAREAPPLQLLSTTLLRLINPAEAERAHRHTTSALHLQACWRGALARRRLARATHLAAAVTHVREMSKPSCLGGVRVPAYVICLSRGGREWAVEHRYSDWRELHAQLSPLLPTLPPLPRRLPFRGKRVTAARLPALHAYLQSLLHLAQASARARLLLTDFLSRSHQAWKYDQLTPPPQQQHALFDRSSGATSASVAQRRRVASPRPQSIVSSRAGNGTEARDDSNAGELICLR
ncbi:MAG: hypothetical protein SGPRY_008554 [Prymnesium sp.]